jgi:predicted outer membrane repeat protein
MSFFSWLRKRPSARSGRRWNGFQNRPTAPRFRPQLEALEERWLPSTWTVINLNNAGSGSLPWAVAQANADISGTPVIVDMTALTGTIKLKSQITITAAMEIDGPGASLLTIDGQKKTRIFNISTTGVVTINDLTIANGKANYGGGMYDFNYYYPNVSTLNLSGVTFMNNQALYFGGALYAAYSTVTVTNCAFTGNKVVAPVAYQGAVGGGAIFSSGDLLTITGTTFSNNTVQGANNAVGSANTDVGLASGGAVLCYYDTFDLFMSDSFSTNWAYGGVNCFGGTGTYTIGVGQGGAIDVYNSFVEIDLSGFGGNGAKGGTGYDAPGSSGGGRIGLGLGGAVEVESHFVGYSSQLYVFDSAFSGNTAQGANGGSGLPGTIMNQGVGGAINAEGSDTYLNVSGSITPTGSTTTFVNNKALGGVSGFATSTGKGYFGSAGVGGAINLGLSASGDISGGIFTQNTAKGANGTGDGAGGYALGGAIDTFPSTLTISGGTQFTNNQAQGGNAGSLGGSGGYALGGGLFCSGGVLNLFDLVFSSNRALGGTGQGTGASGGNGQGGGMQVDFAILTADNLTVQSNLAQGGAGLGGANGGTAYGGGIFAVSNDAGSTLEDSEITQNQALGGTAKAGGSNGFGFAGGLYIDPSLDLLNTSVFNNHASTAYDDTFPP